MTVLLLFSLTSCIKKPANLILASFESERELDGLVWECGRWFELTPLHRTHGMLALKVEISPSQEPIFRVFLTENDWSTYNWFNIDVFNPEHVQLPLTIRFIDEDSDRDPGKYYTKVYALSSGLNHISIPIAEIKKGPQKRNLKLHKMKKIAVLLLKSQQKHTLYFDNIELRK
ncbi:MAG: hypothetical protein VST71_08465 [Nitrospirota bacterium]|nr:hypothetical protein [Nitrospirota bacterium]